MIEELFKKDEYKNEIELVQKTKLFSEQEKHYRTIAIRILKKIPGFKNINEEKSGSKGVPFDLIFLKNTDIGIVEIKGSKKNYNFPDTIQFARLKIILKDFKFENYTIKAYLLQINLNKSMYRIYESNDVLKLVEKIDISLGQKTPTKNILESLYSYINKNTANT